ncbi:hypothetical protein F7R12_22275 [Pseudomonas tolaasii]|nr:hypothetical protein F7R12_22275 [Pseudomonas tolaasii]
MASELARASRLLWRAGLPRVGLRSGPKKAGALRPPTRGKPARHRELRRCTHFGTSIALSIHLPANRSIRYPPTQSRPHKKVRTRPIGTQRHGLIKNCVFLSGSATQASCQPGNAGTDKVLEWLDLSLMR